jgi:hemolysin D
VVKRIFVAEGQHVKQGDPLVELDQVLTRANQARADGELRYLNIALSRHEVLLGLLGKENLKHDLGEMVRPTVISENPLVQLSKLERLAQDNLLAGQWGDYLSQRAALNSQLINRQAELESNAAVIEKLKTTLPLIAKRVDALVILLEKDLVPEMQYLELEQERIERAQDLKSAESRGLQFAAAIDEVRHKSASLKARFTTETLSTIEEYKRQIASQGQELSKAQDMNARQVLHAPVDGVVQQLVIHTVGGVVTEAQPLMLIVPDEGYLEVEAILENKDIGFVARGQSAEIKVHTFPFTK